MKMKLHRKRAVALFLSIVMLVSLAVTSAAYESSGGVISGSDVPMDNGLNIEKVSNPENGEGEDDGLTTGTDRLNSYAWSMRHLEDEHGDYVYIGTNRNILYNAMGAYVGDVGSAIFDLYTNGEISTDASTPGAQIVRYNQDTGETTVYLDGGDFANMPYDGVAMIAGFRSSVEFQGVPYFNGSAYSYTGEQVSMLMRITSNDQEYPELVYSDYGGDLRPMCVSEDGKTMYVGGSSLSGTMEAKPLKFYVMKTTDGKNFEQIASPADFGKYNDDTFSPDIRTSGGDAWDIAEYNGYLYFSMMTTMGGIVFKGHEDPNSNKANEYGWVWEEFIGDDGVYEAGFGNALNYAVTPVPYDGDLYFITFSNAMDSIIYALIGLFEGISTGDMDAYFDGLSMMDQNMENETAVYRMHADGSVDMVVGDRSDIPAGSNIKYAAKVGAGFNNNSRSTTQYNWRATEFNGDLYIGTFDAYPLYKYSTKLTNGDLFEMSQAEFQSQLAYLFTFVNLITQSSSASAMSLNGDGAVAEDQQAPAEEVLTEEVLEQVETLLEQDGAIDATLDDIYEAADWFSFIMGNVAMTYDGEDTGIPAMTEEEIQQVSTALSYVFANLFGEATTAAVSEMMNQFADTLAGLDKLIEISEMIAKQLEGEPEAAIFWQLNEIVVAVRDAITEIDTENIALYVRVSDTIAANDVPGCELYRTSDGVNYTCVTVDGFGDEYNYGVRNILATDDALFVGTANPFYGAQLWKLTEKVPEVPKPVVKKYSIKAVESEGGTISPAGVTKVRSHKDITYTITPAEGYVIKDVLVDGESVGAVSQYTFEKVRANHTILAQFSKVDVAKIFSDVSSGDWFYDDVQFVYDNELMNGVGEGKFNPDGTTNRAMIVTVLWRLEGEPSAPGSAGFSDIPAGQWYTEAVNWAAANSIVNGFEDGSFGPLKAITREQVAAIFERYAEFKGLDTDVVADVEVYTYSAWAEENVIWAESIGLYDNIGVDVSNLTLAASRAEIASYLHVFYPLVVK